MSIPIVLRREASQDVEEARDYLEAEQADLGEAFIQQLRETLTQISTMPELYGVVWRTVRAAVLRRFSYVVYYRIRDDWIEVLAVMHGSRADSLWRDRV